MSLERKILKATRNKQKDYINSLPDEVLCIIFDFLRLSSVKNASATCQRWNSIIFLSGYVKRFVFKIDYQRISNRWIIQRGEQQNESKEKLIMDFKAMVARSQRHYRNVDFFSMSDEEFLSIWKIIPPQLTRHLHSLKFSLGNPSRLFLWLADALPLMQQLSSLTVRGHSWGFRTYQDVIPTLRSDSLKHLEIWDQFKYRLDMPHLKTLTCFLSALYLPDNCRQAVALCSLKDLTVHGNDSVNICPWSIPMLRSLFAQTHLETIKWYSTLTTEYFSLICETCTTLRKLHMTPERNSSNIDHLNGLSKLMNLRILEIFHCSTAIDLSTVNQLEELRLFNVTAVVKLPTSIRKLVVFISSDNEVSMSKTILTSGTQLTELVVQIDRDAKFMQYYAPVYILKALSRLKYLKVLRFCDGSFENSCFLCMDAPLDTLCTLHFENCGLESKRFLGIQEKFPNLKKVRFSEYGRWRLPYDTDWDSS